MRKITNDELGRIDREEFKAAHKHPIVLVVDNVRSQNNIGSFFRTSDAFRIEQIILCGISATPPTKDIHKTALGSELTMAWQYEKECIDAVRKLKEKGYEIYAVEQVEQSISLGDFTVDHNKKYALVVGNEVDGVAQEVVDECHGAIEIPQEGTKHSLNVSVAAGVVLWHFFSNIR
ncbi:MAG: RNA methyltransferase [Rikenellaceae bacterium]